MLDKICKIANDLKEQGNYKAASVLYSIITDIAIYEERDHIVAAYDKANSDLKVLQANLSSAGLHRLAREVDVIARDIENRALAFSVEDPIQSVLHSYKVIHKLAKTEKLANNVQQDIIDLVESEQIPDRDLPKHLKEMMLGLTEQEKKNILYILEKDYNLSIPLEKIAKKPKKPELTEEEKCLDEAETLKERAQCLDDQEKEKLKMQRSWPSAPSMWSGFAYEAIVPYHQNSQLNFWSLASDEEKVLKRISKKK